ncbi:MAG: hypothetical protein PHH23_00605 [Paludibacteraceae bacterium]|jgi:hypothetical protein|nr:hypothetical protein [Paludibacteraceae bacterium]
MKRKCYVILIVFLCFLLLCLLGEILYRNFRVSNKIFFQYYIGKIKIENPIGININEKYYVFSDSLLNYCHTADFFSRPDVFEYNYKSNFITEIEDYSSYYPSIFFKSGFWDTFYHRDTFLYSLNDSISVFGFYFDKEVFLLSLQNDATWVDPRMPLNINMDSIDLNMYDQWDSLVYSNKYKLTVRPDYNVIEILKLRFLNDR